MRPAARWSHLQRSALDPVTVDALHGHKDLLPRLREAVAGATGIEVPKLAEEKRVSWVNLVFGIGTLIGIWAIIGVLADVGQSLDVIKGASWGWVALTFVLAQLPMVAEAWAVIGSVPGQLPFGRCVALETSNTFTALVGGDVAVFAVRVRFFQRQGSDAAAAVSSGAIASTASWMVKTLLFLVSIPFAAGAFHAPTSSGGREEAVWIVVGVVLAAGIAIAAVTLVPRLRRLATSRIRPHLVTIWANVKTIATEPRKIVYVLAGSVLASSWWPWPWARRCTRSASTRASRRILVVITLASIVGGAVPGARRPGRRGGGPDRRAHQRRHTPGTGRRRGVHPAAVHRLPAADLGLVHPGLDAPPRVRVTRRRDEPTPPRGQEPPPGQPRRG